jgi:ABC-type dipeptide/oligopeptide/nickel transport system permease component
MRRAGHPGDSGLDRADITGAGFDQPIYEQYGKWLWQLLHGNFGFDVQFNA